MPLHRVVTLSRLVTQCNRSTFILTKTQQAISCRSLTIETPKQRNQLKNEKLRTYIVKRYIDYVKGYTKVLETRFPTAMRMYRVFSIGIKDFLKDLKTYIGLRIKVAREHGFSNMSRQDIELYQRMPSDMLRIAPVLILSAIPFGNYVIFPLAFLKPRTLLCSHFWSIQQRAEFSTQQLRERLKNNRPVFRAMQAKLDSIPDGELKERWTKVIASLGSGVHPTVLDVLACKELFAKEPYELNSLTYSHAIQVFFKVVTIYTTDVATIQPDSLQLAHFRRIEHQSLLLQKKQSKISTGLPRDLVDATPLIYAHRLGITRCNKGHLLKMYGKRRSILRVSKLKYKAFMFLQLDNAIIREGGVNVMSTESLRYACHLRGLNSSYLTNKDMRKWLDKWLFISQHVDKSNYSLLLHCPIFLAYNHPHNWMLIY